MVSQTTQRTPGKYKAKNVGNPKDGGEGAGFGA